MINIAFKDWFLLEAERMPLASVDRTCQTTCASATVIWLIELMSNWESILPKEEVEKFSPYVREHGASYIEGLQVNTENFEFNSRRLGKRVAIIPQEEEVRGVKSPGVRPVSGSITVRPRKPEMTAEHGNYVGMSDAIKVPYNVISKIKAIGGCALTCLHMSGGHVDVKTVGGYKKTFMYKTNQDLFYNNTLEQYFKAAIGALYENCRKGKDLDHYAIRLNGTTDIKHYANAFLLDQKTIDGINKYLRLLNGKSSKEGNPIEFKSITLAAVDGSDRVVFFDIFNQMWKQATTGIKCNFNPAFLQFYDYTAIPGLMKTFGNKALPSNYHITFSVKEGNLKETMDALSKGLGVALPIWIGGVKKSKVGFPQFWYPLGFGKGQGYRVVDGDTFDARFLDKKTYGIAEDEGYVVGLRAKGKLEDVEDFDSGFSERMLLNYKTPQIKQLKLFGQKYPKLAVGTPAFEQAKQDFLVITGSTMNPRFDPNDPAVNNIILEQIVYTLRRNGIKINGMGALKAKDFYDAQEKRGLKTLVNVKDLDYDKLHGTTMGGTSAKTEKGDVGMTGTSAKVEKGTKLKVKTNQMNMLPHTTFAALRNMLTSMKGKGFKEWLELKS